MDDLTEQIASEIGPKWVQLLSKLQLGYRDRYRLCVQYKDEPKPVQEANCTRDTIRLWRVGLLAVSEKEAMAQLLTALKKVKGFEDRAKELADSYGISLNLPLLPTTSSQERTDGNNTPANGPGPTPVPTTTTSSPLTQSTTDTQITPPTLSPPTHPHSSSGSGDTHSSAVDTGADTSNNVPEIPHSHHVSEQQPPKFTAHSPSLSTSSTERSEDPLLNSTVDISVMKHKFVMLDVCQRLPASAMTDFARRLSIPHEKVQQINNDFVMQEERYYQVLKCWVEGGGRTFLELKGALEACQQQTASEVVLRRLQSPGLTLRAPTAV